MGEGSGEGEPAIQMPSRRSQHAGGGACDDADTRGITADGLVVAVRVLPLLSLSIKILLFIKKIIYVSTYILKCPP